MPEHEELSKMGVKLAPSILSANFGQLGEQISEATQAGAEYIHLDIMDGHFVPNITIGSPVVKSLRPLTKALFDVHLMVTNPEAQISLFAEAGADIITVHVESCPHVHRAVAQIKRLGIKAGVALNPGSPVSLLDAVLPSVDLALVMTVDPGFGGQPFIEGMLSKIADLRERINAAKLPVELEVDGGINAEIAPKVVKAGATVLVAGAAVFNSSLGITRALSQIRESFA